MVTVFSLQYNNDGHKTNFKSVIIHCPNEYAGNEAPNSPGLGCEHFTIAIYLAALDLFRSELFSQRVGPPKGACQRTAGTPSLGKHKLSRHVLTKGGSFTTSSHINPDFGQV